MSTFVIELSPRAYSVTCTGEALIVDLVDGRSISAPLVWFPKLCSAAQAQRDKWELLGDGEGIRWADIDEDLSVAGLLAGGRLSVAKTKHGNL